MKGNIKSFLKVLLLSVIWAGNTFAVLAQQAGNVIITGTVLDENNEPLIGASVLAVGTTIGTITDFDGKFTLEVPKGSNIQFSYIGYNTQILSSDQKTINIKLVPDTQMLSDVVVIGYGTQRKSDLTGSVTNVSSEDFNTGLVSSPEQLKDFRCTDYVKQRFAYCRKYNTCTWRCFTQCQQRPAYRTRRCTFGAGRHQR